MLAWKESWRNFFVKAVCILGTVAKGGRKPRDSTLSFPASHGSSIISWKKNRYSFHLTITHYINWKFYSVFYGMAVLGRRQLCQVGPDVHLDSEALKWLHFARHIEAHLVGKGAHFSHFEALRGTSNSNFRILKTARCILVSKGESLKCNELMKGRNLFSRVGEILQFQKHRFCKVCTAVHRRLEYFLDFLKSWKQCIHL